jgi:dipeptidyl aminopeptidase/acylaminoacyl peptidase
MFLIRKIHYIYILAIFITASLYAQERVITADDLFNMRAVAETAVSPDGKAVAYTVIIPRRLNEDPGNDYRHLFIKELPNGEERELLGGQNNIVSISWSTDGKQIYFRSRMKDDRVVQVYRVNRTGGSPQRVTNSASSVTVYELNPRGGNLAYTATEEHPSQKRNMVSRGFDAEVYEEEDLHLNLYIQDLNAKEGKRVTTDFTIFEFKWSPNGDRIAGAIADRNLVDHSYMFKRIFIVDPRTGGRQKIVENPGKLSDLSWSPDGAHIAFVGGVDINDPVSGSLFVVDVNNPQDFKQLRNYTEGFIGSVEKVEWLDNITMVYISEEGVDMTLSSIGINDKERKLLIEGGRVVFRSMSKNGDIISFAGNTPTHTAELFTLNLRDNQLQKLTNLSNWLQGYRLAKQEKITYKARDGLEIEAVLVYPIDFKEGERYPLINYIHGGPEAAVQNGWTTSYGMWGQIAAAKGFFVMMPNYRASSGRGVEFSKMDFGELGAEEFDDVLDGINNLVERGWVDRKRVGIGGGSYGGFFAAWGATRHTEHFVASVMFVGISNQISKRFTTDIPYEMYHVHWGVWPHENWELHLERSPVRYAHESRTPTLILHGKEDPRVHPSQSLELYRALKTHGKAPVRLIWYPGQGHGNAKNTSKYDYAVRTMDWFEYYLKGNNPRDRMPNKYLSIE